MASTCLLSIPPSTAPPSRAQSECYVFFCFLALLGDNGDINFIWQPKWIVIIVALLRANSLQTANEKNSICLEFESNFKCIQMEQISSLGLAISHYNFMFSDLLYSFHSYIPEAISCLIGRDRFVVVYKQKLGHTAYLPDQSVYARDLFHTLCTR